MRLSSLVLSMLLASSPVLSSPALHAESALDTQALVQRLVLERAATVAALQRVADEREEQLFADLAAKDRKLRAEQKAKREAQADLAEVTSQRQTLVDEIAARDRRFAAEISEYRKQVVSIASSPDPRKREALRRYSEGERLAAYEDLKLIQRAETKAVAAGWRELGALGLDLKDRGEIGTAEALSNFEEAQRLDPDDAWGWIQLLRLYRDAGRRADARHAAEQALEHAEGDRARAAALSDLGDVLVSSGDLAGARVRYESSLKMAEELASSNPGSAEAQRDLIVGHTKVASFPQGESHWKEALRIALALQSQGRLAPSDEPMIDYLRQKVAETEHPKDPP